MRLLIILAVLAFQNAVGQKISLSEKMIDSLYNKSKTFWYNNPDSGKYYLNQVLQLSQQGNYLKGEANALKGLGFLTSSHAEALQYYFKALSIREQIKDSIGIGISLLDIGVIYARIGEKEKMGSYYQRSLEIRKKINDYGGVALCLINFGQLDEEKNDFTGALKKFKEALLYRLKAGELNGIAYAHINIANANLSLKNYDSALFYNDLANSEFRKANNLSQTQWVVWIKSKCYFEQGYLDKALIELKHLENSSDWLSAKNLQLLADLYEQKKDYQKALHYKKQWIAENNDAGQKSNDQAARSLAADYEFKLREVQLKQEEEKQLLQKKRYDNLQFLIIAIVLIGIFILTFSIRKRLSVRTVNVITFIGTLLFFEFLVVLADPQLQLITRNQPLLLLLGNVLIAAVVTPLHNFLETRLKRRL